MDFNRHEVPATHQSRKLDKFFEMHWEFAVLWRYENQHDQAGRNQH